MSADTEAADCSMSEVVRLTTSILSDRKSRKAQYNAEALLDLRRESLILQVELATAAKYDKQCLADQNFMQFEFRVRGMTITGPVS